MAAAVTESKVCRVGRLLTSNSTVYFQTVRKSACKSTCLFLMLFLVLWVLPGGLADSEFLKREYSLTKPYQGLGSSHWDLMGSAMVTTDHVRLTADLQSRQGAVWSRIPCSLRDWELQVQFKVHGEGKKNFHGDGLAVWLTKERMQNGPVFGNMNHFTGLGIFVDTYANEEKNRERVYPYVSAMLGNGTLSYDHERDGRPTEVGGCAAMVRNVNHDTFLLIRYIRNRLLIMTDVDGHREWRDCADISGVRLPLGYYFGASSATGDLSDNHDLISMKLYELTVDKTKEEEEQREEEEEVTVPRVDNLQQFIVEVQEQGMSGVQYLVTAVFSLLGLAVLGAIGLMAYRRWQEKSRKRFY